MVSSVRGVGLGLRFELIDELVERLPEEIDFLEIAPENYLRRGGHLRAKLERLLAHYPVVTHGLTLSLAGTEPLDAAYLADVASFVRDVGSPWHSDHLCFGASGGRLLHDLLPVPLTRATIDRVVPRARQVVDALGVPFAVENISFYLHAGAPEMREPELLRAVCEEADVGILFDVNNAWVNATNFGEDVDAWLREGPLDKVVQMHVAGHTAVEGGLLVDTHGAPVAPPVFAFLERVLARTGPVPIVLERDTAMPSLDELLTELDEVRAICTRAAKVQGK